MRRFLSLILLSAAVLLPGAASAKTVPHLDPAKDLLSGIYMVTLKTTKGTIRLRLFADEAPLAVTNFVSLAKAGFYDGLTFHRVIPGFMIQGGDPNGNGTGGTSVFGETFKDELTGKEQYVRGVVAMANRGPDTNGSQFFIIQKDYPLPPSYTIFGKVVSGMTFVDAIANVPSDPNNHPLTPVTFRMTVRKIRK